MNKLVEEYIKNGKEIQRIKGETEEKEKQALDEGNKTIDEIYERKRLIDQEDSKARAEHTMRLEAINKKEQEERAPFDSQRDAVRRIVAFLEVQERFKPAAFINERKAREGEFWEWQDWIHNDDFLKIRLCIAENDKPVNIYTVRAHITSVFYNPLIELPYSSRELGSFKTVDEAKAYITKKKDRLFQDEIKAVEALKVEYQKVIAAYKLSDFEELFEYRCGGYDCRAKFKTPTPHTKEISTGYKDGNYIREIVKCESEHGWRREVIS